MDGRKYEISIHFRCESAYISMGGSPNQLRESHHGNRYQLNFCTLKDHVYLTYHHAHACWVLGPAQITQRNLKTQLFYFHVWPTVHTNASWETELFQNALQTGGIENAGFLFSCGRKTFWKRSFSRKRWHHDNHVISLTEFSSNTNLTWPVIFAITNFSGVVWMENIWCVFRVKLLFLNFSRVVWTGS